MLRFIFTAAFVVLFLIFSIPILIAEWIIGKFDVNFKNRSSLAIVKQVFRICLFLSGTKSTVLGSEKMPQNESVLFVANHQSYFDILLTYILMLHPTGYVAKREMIKWPLLSTWMKNLHCQFLDRKNVKEGMKTIVTCIGEVKSGISIFIFPEGTRNKNPEHLMDFHGGSFKIAEKSGCLIVPISITNSSAVWEDHFPFIRPAHVILEYGDPIDLKLLNPEEKKNLPRMIQQQIEETANKNRKLI